MSEQLPDIAAPNAASRFAVGGGFAGEWFPALAASIKVMGLEVLGLAQKATTAAIAAARTAVTSEIGLAKQELNQNIYAAVNTSHLKLEPDGTPTFSQGSMTLRVYSDTDGVPYFQEL